MSVKKRKLAERSTLALVASGVSTISIGQKMPTYRVRSTNEALAQDHKAIGQDFRRAGKHDREYA